RDRARGPARHDAPDHAAALRLRRLRPAGDDARQQPVGSPGAGAHLGAVARHAPHRRVGRRPRRRRADARRPRAPVRVGGDGARGVPGDRSGAAQAPPRRRACRTGGLVAALEETQFQLGRVVFGRDLPIEVRVFEVGAAEAELGDTDLPGQDGMVFGRDAKRGSDITFELSVLRRDPDEARALFGELAAEWDAAAARRTPRRVVALRIRQPGSRTVVVYGRPRSLEVTSSAALRKVGRIDATATFQAADSLFYGEVGEEGAARQITLTLVASAGGGIVWPVTWPITWGTQGQRQDAVVNRGDAPTWPVITIYGPVANPSVELVGTGRVLRLDTTLAFDR